MQQEIPSQYSHRIASNIAKNILTKTMIASNAKKQTISNTAHTEFVQLVSHSYVCTLIKNNGAHTWVLNLEIVLRYE